MKKYFKRITSMLLVVAMTLTVLSACGGGSDGNDDSNASTDNDNASYGDASAPSGDYPVTPEELGSGTVKWSESETADGWKKVTNDGGPELGYSKDGMLIQVDGFAFRDLNGDGLLDEYEDWRLDVDARAQALAMVLPVEEMAGLMVHASSFSPSDDASETIPLLDEGVRTILGFGTSFPVETQAKWNNAMQAYVEGKGHSLPVNISTNPRTTPTWPDNLALGATFDPELVFEVSKGLAEEYRAIGVSILLGPQIDLSTDPRWSRISGTFSEDPALSRDMTNASVSGHQSTFDENGNDLGWGADSVNAMIKHWPGDGAGEGGRESHDWYGQFTVYPGGQFETPLIPYVDGGFVADSETGSATGVMTSYSAAWSENEEYGELVGSAFSEYKIELLRSYGFDDVICTDWGVVTAPGDGMFSTGWGVDGLTSAELVYKAIMAGVDQLGDLSVPVANVMSAFETGVSEHGEDVMLMRFQDSSRRILRNSFRVGLFENPYVDVARAKEIVAGPEAAAKGYEAQLKSIVMLKNSDNTIQEASGADKPTVYVPMSFTPASESLMGSTPASASLAVDRKTLDEYFNVVTDTVNATLTGPADADGNPTVSLNDIVRATKEELADCDYALVFVDSPNNISGLVSSGYDPVSETFIPISLQYEPYTANSSSVRGESISGPMVETEITNVYGVQVVMKKQNTSYYGNSAQITNDFDLDTIKYAVENMPEEAKIIVALNASNPTVVSEFEGDVDAILVGFNVEKKAFVDIASGKHEPSALLPIQFPKDMEAVEVQLEDVPRDMECYIDTDGNTYDFTFGLNWSGVISDARTAKYNVPALTTPTATP